jgi:hypothetical protein
MAREQAEVKADVKDLRRLLLSRKSAASSGPTEVNPHPVFNKHVALPLRSIEDFKYFEEELLKEDVKLNLVG